MGCCLVARDERRKGADSRLCSFASVLTVEDVCVCVCVCV
jgi:hypothetical protein